MPILQLWSEQYRKQGLRLVGITEMSTDPKVISAELKDLGVRYPAVTDFGERIAARYRIEAHPTTYILDRTGRIRHVEEGFLKGDEIEMQKIVEKLLGERPVAKSTRTAKRKVARR